MQNDGIEFRIRRAVRTAWCAARQGVIDFYNSNNLTFASSIAFYSLLSLFPFVLLLLSFISRLTVGENKDQIMGMIELALPRQFDFIATQIQGLANATVRLTVAGTILTIWASMGVFGALTTAVNHAWGVEKHFSFFKHKLVSFVMLLTAGGLMLTALLLESVVEIIQARWFAGVVFHVPGLERFTGFMYRNATTPLFTIVVGLIYYFAPNARVRLRDVWFGAILAAVLWRFAFAGFAWYVRDLTRFSSVHGQIGTVVAFLLWVYVSAVILLYGVEVTAAYARLRRENRTPAEAIAEAKTESELPAAL
jgi:membrane protein